MKRLVPSLSVVCCLVWTTTQVLASDLIPPSWRGNPGATLQEWAFNNDSSVALPPDPGFFNPFGTPTLTIDKEEAAAGWWSSFPDYYGTKQGFWDIGRGDMTLHIPNLTGTGPSSSEDLQIQITYWLDGFGLSSQPWLSNSPFASQVGPTINTLIESVSGTGSWWSMLTTWHITPNPGSETLTIWGGSTYGSVIDEVVVDAISIPEPSAMSIAFLGFALGGLRLYFLRRRKS